MVLWDGTYVTRLDVGDARIGYGIHMDDSIESPVEDFTASDAGTWTLTRSAPALPNVQWGGMPSSPVPIVWANY